MVNFHLSVSQLSATQLQQLMNKKLMLMNQKFNYFNRCFNSFPPLCQDLIRLQHEHNFYILEFITHFDSIFKIMKNFSLSFYESNKIKQQMMKIYAPHEERFNWFFCFSIDSRSFLQKKVLLYSSINECSFHQTDLHFNRN